MQRTANEAERTLTEFEEAGQVNHAQAQAMRNQIEAERAAGLVRMGELAQGRYDDAHRFGEPALEEFRAIAPEAEALADELAHGLDPAEGRRRLDALLARHAHASAQEDQFHEAAITVVTIDDDPDSANEAFLSAHPDVRTEFGW